MGASARLVSRKARTTRAVGRRPANVGVAASRETVASTAEVDSGATPAVDAAASAPGTPGTRVGVVCGPARSVGRLRTTTTSSSSSTTTGTTSTAVRTTTTLRHGRHAHGVVKPQVWAVVLQVGECGPWMERASRGGGTCSGRPGGRDGGSIGFHPGGDTRGCT